MLKSAFSPFPSCFSPYHKQIVISATFDLLSANAFSLAHWKIFSFGSVNHSLFLRCFTEDLLCVAAEDLWRSRSGSGSSFSESRFWNFPKVDDKFSLAYKSYSSGDLGPVLPVGESEASMKNRLVSFSFTNLAFLEHRRNEFEILLEREKMLVTKSC